MTLVLTLVDWGWGIPEHQEASHLRFLDQQKDVVLLPPVAEPVDEPGRTEVRATRSMGLELGFLCTIGGQ